MEDWLRASLIRRGVLDEAGASRRVSFTRCRSCRRSILHGFDADVCAITVQVDPEPVDELGEAIAILNGLRTYAMTPLLRKAANSFALDHRRPAHIKSGTRHYVLTEHRCYSEIPRKAITVTEALPNDPPF